MRRALAVLALVGAAAGVTAIGPFGDDDAVRYRVVLDNSFGLTEGADFRTAGVKAGSVEKLDVETRTARAVATVKVSEGGFGTLKADATCEVLPQSLIGEYFLDCQPGRSRENLPADGTVPVERTAGTVPPDLVQSVLQRPERERLAILLSELGAGLASRGGDVNTAIRRAVPALRETDRVLDILGDEQARLRALIRDADVVVGRLADGRDDVARFVSEARDTAQASADRREALRGTIQRFPEFQRQLRPVLADLSTVARRQTPALRDLRAAAGDLTTLLQRLGPFADATVPALVSLGEASDTGRRAVRVADATVARLRTLARDGEEPSRNLRFVGEHIDDRANAVEPDPESPGGAGYTGLEALLQYPFVQAQAINLFDTRGYTLKLSALINECTQYRNGESVKADETLRRTCSAAMGPGGPLEDEPDAAQQRDARPQATPERTTPQAPAQQPTAQQPTTPQAPATPQLPKLELPEIRIPGLPPIKLPPLLGGSRDDTGEASRGLLDFLLGGGG